MFFAPFILTTIHSLLFTQNVEAELVMYFAASAKKYQHVQDALSRKKNICQGQGWGSYFSNGTKLQFQLRSYEEL